jgi:hypothetical protein
MVEEEKEEELDLEWSMSSLAVEMIGGGKVVVADVKRRKNCYFEVWNG